MLHALTMGAAYSALGIVLLAVGFVVVDLLTPGSLGRHIYERRSLNAGIVVSAVFCALGAIMFTAIWTNGDGGDLVGLGWVAVFGVLGIVLQAVAFLVLDLLTPGSLREMVVERELHPGALVAAAAMIAVGAVVCASIA